MQMSHLSTGRTDMEINQSRPGVCRHQHTQDENAVPLFVSENRLYVKADSKARAEKKKTVACLQLYSNHPTCRYTILTSYLRTYTDKQLLIQI